VKKRFIISLVTAGLMAAVLPGLAAAQTEGEGTLVFGDNNTCEFGQGSALPLPACEFNEDGTIITITFSNPQDRSGPFDGVQVLSGSFVGNTADFTFEVSGTSYFAGEVEGCGPGTVYFDYAGGGTLDENLAPVWETNTYTAVPGGTLPITATIDEVGVNAATPNGDGTSTLTYTATYSCDEAPAAEGEADADVEEAADDAEEQADAKEDELEDKADEKEEELKDAD
jgi:hypothetical protein